MDKINIILADDHILVRNGIKSLLESEDVIQVIDEVSNGYEALTAIAKHPPHLLIADIRMPEMNGIELIKEVKKKYPDIKTLVLSMHNSEQFVVQSVQAGADGYILKGTSKEEFLKALHTVAAGGKYFTGDVSSAIINSFMNISSAEPQQQPLVNKIPVIGVSLTKRERQILSLVLDGLSNKEIGDKLSISKRTAEVHRFNLMKKLKVKNYSELLQKVQELNLVK